ncbi:MAG: FAD-dependent oxidoreductase [Bacteroidetes bacterium]|nr:FAD-dependent oxidoreductase [Bacteroidota bacterium]MBS1929670.1 FAD-dependent oxidoreductase [Bacteroidota bacterium]
MQKKISLKLLPSEATHETLIKNHIAQSIGEKESAVSGFNIIKRSIDARSKQPWINLTLQAFIHEPYQAREKQQFAFLDVEKSNHKVIIVGAGPAGLFAALKLLESGIKPVILERGKDVKSRRRDLAILNKQGIVNPESNYCFGEGGAGTYSDGKLYTRSSKRGDINRILNLFVHFGADDSILFESHPHIGTNKLPHIITAITKKITDCSGEIHFEKKVIDLIIKKSKIVGVKTNTGEFIESDAVILATGHSARDIFQLVQSKKILLAFKPFALGVRVEHPQPLIDIAQYHCSNRGAFLPPASYSLVEQVDGKGVFSFCMCPGGIIAPAATAPGEVVVNGWSPSKRNNPYANSGIVVSIEEKDVQAYKKSGPLAGIFFQQEVEQKAFQSGGGNLAAPAQRLVDFTENLISASLPGCSYLPGIHSTALKEVLPEFIHKRLQTAFKEYGKKMPARYGGKSFFTNDAVVVATESRTSSPVRIPRNEETLQHPQIKDLYPCGEGSGYAGGIVSAAMDGEKVASMVAKFLKNG